MKTPYWFTKKTLLAFLLLPLSLVYYVVSRTVYWLRSKKQIKSKRKIICVGNILTGGVGKTPIVRQIAKYLDAPVVMRGYKKSENTAGLGDEAVMLANDGLIVHVGDRKSNIVLLNKQSSDTPIVMDDGFQNPTIKKDVSILVFDEGLGYGNGFLLPAGPLRETKRALKRADAIIVIRNKNPKKKFKLPYGKPVFYAENQTVSPYDENQKVVAFAGIGYPVKFYNSLNNVVKTVSFSDHYQYTDKDIEQLCELAKKNNARLITTEKDWVRLPVAVRDEIKYAKLETKIDNSFFEWLGEKLK